MRRLVDSNAQGVLFWNTKGAILEANDEFLRIVGYTREDLEAGRLAWATMTPSEYAHLDRHSLEEIAATGVCTPFEKEYIRKSVCWRRRARDDSLQSGYHPGQGYHFSRPLATKEITTVNAK